MKTFKCEICGDVYKKTMSVNDEEVVTGICGSKCVEKYTAKYMATRPDALVGAPPQDIPSGINGPAESV